MITKAFQIKLVLASPCSCITFLMADMSNESVCGDYIVTSTKQILMKKAGLKFKNYVAKLFTILLLYHRLISP